MLWMLAALLGGQPWENVQVDVLKEDDRALIRKVQQDTSMARERLIFSKTVTGTTHSLAMKDFFKIEREGDVWFERRDGTGASKGLRSMELEHVNCVAKSSGMLELHVYRDDGTERDSYVAPAGVPTMSRAIPDSAGELLVAAACRDFD
jgi:hypothetical protein